MLRLFRENNEIPVNQNVKANQKRKIFFFSEVLQGGVHLKGVGTNIVHVSVCHLSMQLFFLKMFRKPSGTLCTSLPEIKYLTTIHPLVVQIWQV